MDGVTSDFVSIEIVNTPRHAQVRARKDEQQMIDAGLLPAPLPTPVTRKEHGDLTMSLASKATMEVDYTEEGLGFRSVTIGIH